MSDHSAGYMLNDFILKIGERGIIDYAQRPEAVGMLVRLAQDLVEWKQSSGYRGAYIQDANFYEIAGDLPRHYHFCSRCGHGMDAPSDDDEWTCAECAVQPPNTWYNAGRPPPG